MHTLPFALQTAPERSAHLPFRSSNCSERYAHPPSCISNRPGEVSTPPPRTRAHADEEGRRLFSSITPACAICHTLKAAGAAGEIGPSLDELKPDAERVAKAVRNGIGQMPAFATLTEAQIQALARYVAAAAAK